MSQKRDEYVQKLQIKLDEWNREIDKLEKQSDRVVSDARTQYEKRVLEAKLKQKELEEKLNEVRHASGAAWEDLKSGIDLAWDAMSYAVKSAKSKFDA